LPTTRHCFNLDV